MKPEDLKPLYVKEERRIYIDDRIFYVPERSDEQFFFPGWNHADLFNNDHPVIVEYCSGNGTWIANKAIQYPEINWVAVEIKFARVRKIWSKIKNLKLKNLIVVCGEAHLVTKNYFPDNSIKHIYINFPDPWPKKRHAKNRLIQPTFAAQISRILIKGNGITFVTDDVPYSDWFIEIMNQNPDFISEYSFPFYFTDEANYGTSYFDELWRSKGRVIRHHVFKKH